MTKEILFWFEIPFNLNIFKGLAGNYDAKSDFLDDRLLRFTFPFAKDKIHLLQ